MGESAVALCLRCLLRVGLQLLSASGPFPKCIMPCPIRATFLQSPVPPVENDCLKMGKHATPTKKIIRAVHAS